MSPLEFWLLMLWLFVALLAVTYAAPAEPNHP